MSNAPVLILGAKSDIARAIAHQYAANGYSLILAARVPDDLAADLSDLQTRYDVETQAIAFDALDTASHSKLFESLPTVPAGVICVVGYLGDQREAELDFDESRRIIDTNYTGLVSILNLAANAFSKRGSGFIVGISSVAGDRGRQSNYTYGSAKAAFTAYLSGLRNRLAHCGVHVMTVKPGFVHTKMTENLELPGALTAQPEQVAKAVYRGQKNRRNVIYTRWYWRPIMFAIKSVPEMLFKKLKL